MSIKEQLYEPLEIRSRRGRGNKDFNYVAWQDVADRLNNVFGVNWSSEIVTFKELSNNIIVQAKVTVYDKETDKYYWQEGFGGAPNDERLEAGNPFKAAYSKAIKDACKKWGIGLYLEDEDAGFAGGSMPNMSANPPAGHQGPEVGVPPAPSVSAPAYEQAPAPKQEAPQTPPAPQVPTTPSVPNVPTPNSGPVQSQSAPSTPSTPPSVPPSAPPQAPPADNRIPKDDMPMSSGAINNGPAQISDVQKVALDGILMAKNLELGSLVGEAFAAAGLEKEAPKSKEDLTYEEAVIVIKYGNDKLRRS